MSSKISSYSPEGIFEAFDAFDAGVFSEALDHHMPLRENRFRFPWRDFRWLNVAHTII